MQQGWAYRIGRMDANVADAALTLTFEPARRSGRALPTTSGHV